MTIKEIHDFIFDLLMDKEQTGHVSHERVDQALDAQSRSLFRHYLTLLGTSVDADEALGPFKKSLPFNSDAQGVYTIPLVEAAQRIMAVNVSVFDSVANKSRPHDAEMVPAEGWAKRVDSQLNPVTPTSTICRVEGLDTLKFEPKQVHAGTVFFVRLPKTPKFNYTLAGRVVTYSSGGSQDLEWKGTYQNEVILGTLTLLGVNLADELKIQVSEALLQKNP